jgi:hypothetical protein
MRDSRTFNRHGFSSPLVLAPRYYIGRGALRVRLQQMLDATLLRDVAFD